MTDYEDYQRRLKLAEQMIDRAPNAMERELTKKGIRENITSDYFRIAANKLSKYRLNYRHEADLKERLINSLKMLEHNYMQAKYARMRR